MLFPFDIVLRGVDTLVNLPEALFYAVCRDFVFGVPRFYPSFFVLLKHFKDSSN